MDIKKLAGVTLLAVVVLWIVGAIVSHSHKAGPPQTVQASTRDKWQVTEGQSPMDDSKTIVLTLDSDNQVQGPNGAVRPSLMVHCEQKKTAVYVVTGMAASIEEDVEGGPSDFPKVGLRLDDDPASYHSWGESSDHKALFASDLIWGEQWDSLIGMNAPKVVAYSGGVVELAKKLTGASTLTFQFTPFDGSPQVARFDVRGLGPHLHKVAEACGWAYE